MTKQALQPQPRTAAPPPFARHHRGHSPEHVIRTWLKALEKEDAAGLASLYAHDAVLDQPARHQCRGREAIRKRLADQISDYVEAGCEIRCSPVRIFEEGHWGILQWQDALGLDACSVFKIDDGRIVRQRDYWDSTSHEHLYG